MNGFVFTPALSYLSFESAKHTDKAAVKNIASAIINALSK